MPDMPSAGELSAEDAKLVTLARGARGRVASDEGAALRDETGRTYVGATVELQSLRLSALQVAVAQAVAAGARGVEAAVVVTDAAEPDAGGLAAVRDLAGPGVPVLALAPGGSTGARTLT
ncbi:MAG: cytidine deaminase [Actinomycetota bacterium]|nr:cytidine deaminase [Actinomycetota bacterium]